MKKSYAQLVKQIEGLQAEAEKLRQQEVAGVVAKLRETIVHYGLTAEDLGLAAKAAAKPAAKKKARAAKPAAKPRRGSGKSAVAPRFRDEAGNSWVGIGKRPQWLRDALANGKKLEDFAVN